MLRILFNEQELESYDCNDLEMIVIDIEHKEQSQTLPSYCYFLSFYNESVFILTWRSFSSIYAILVATLKSRLFFSSFSRLIEQDFVLQKTNKNTQVNGSYRPLKKRKFHVTMSRGPMVRKKKSLFYVGFSSRRVSLSLEMSSVTKSVHMHSNTGGSSIVSLMRISKDLGYLGLNLSNYSS